jgi:hypothetical protein
VSAAETATGANPPCAGDAASRGGDILATTTPLRTPGIAPLHPRLKLLLAGAGSLLLTLLAFRARELPLPNDGSYAASLFMMWPRRAIGGAPVQMILFALDVLCALVPVTMIAAIALPARLLQHPPAVLRILHQHALVIPLFAFVTTALPRYIANAAYALIDPHALGTTFRIGTIEASLIESVQRSFGTPAMNHVWAAVYAGGWMLGLLAIPAVLVWLGQPVAVTRIVVGWMLAAVLAVPFFVLLPVFEPWALNPAYGYLGSGQTVIEFLAAEGAHARLAALLQQHRVATALCLPSLHVALPTLVAAISFERRLPRVGGVFVGLTVAVSIAVVCLGRHWITDVAAGVAYGIAIARLADALRPERLLLLDRGFRL